MDVSFLCPGCQSKLEFDAAAYPPGMEIDCPGCSSSISVPRPVIGPGITIGGFELKKLLGKGGMGEVYLATQRSMHRDVALKILPEHFAIQEGAVDRFLQEVKMAARLNHPNIVRAYEAGEDHGVYYLAMDYVAGTAIDQRLKEQGAMPENEVRIIAEKLGRALDQIWDKHKMIHRDIKPANIMLDEYGEPLLMDMGLSKTLEDGEGLSLSTAIMGSPNYMSPEQSEGTTGLDFRTDMYSLGATFYHMLTGKVPFKGKSVMEVLRKQATEQLPDPRSHNPDISEGMVRILERMMAKQTGARYANWQEFLKALEALVFGAALEEPALSPEESVMIRTTDLPPTDPAGALVDQSSGGLKSKKPFFIGMGATVATLVIVGLLVMKWPGTDASKAKPHPANDSAVATGPSPTAVAVGLSPTEILTSPYWKWTEPELLKNLSSPHTENHPTLSADGLILIFTSNRPGGSGLSDLWEASRSSIDSPFGEPKPLGALINTDRHEFVPWISPDGLSLLFSRTADGATAQGYILHSQRESRDAPWSEPVHFGPSVPADRLPRVGALSSDGRELWCEMSNGDALKVHLARRTGPDEPFAPFIEQGLEINEPRQAGGPKLTADGQAMLYWAAAAGESANLYLARRAADGKSFERGGPLPEPPNSSEYEVYPAISGDGKILIFKSNRQGGLGAQHDLWMSRRVPK